MSAIRDIEFEGVGADTLAALRQLVEMKWQLAALEAQREQDALAAATPEMNSVDGLGPVVRNIHPFAFHDWAFKEGSYDCWKDRSFNKYMDRIAPETKPVCRGLKPGNGLALQVGWTPPTKRFQKKYSESREGGEGSEGREVRNESLPSPPSLPSQTSREIAA